MKKLFLLILLSLLTLFGCQTEVSPYSADIKNAGSFEASHWYFNMTGKMMRTNREHEKIKNPKDLITKLNRQISKIYSPITFEDKKRNPPQIEFVSRDQSTLHVNIMNIDYLINDLEYDKFFALATYTLTEIEGINKIAYDNSGLSIKVFSRKDFEHFVNSKPLPLPEIQEISSEDMNKYAEENFSATLNILENKLPLWIDLWREKNIELTKDKWRKGEIEFLNLEKNFNPTQFENLPEEREDLFVYSPDKTKIIDPHGGMEVFEKNGETHAAFDADSSVDLIDMSKKQLFFSILFCGTPCDFDDAVWIDNDRFFIVGSSEYYPENNEERCTVDTKCTYVPTLTIFDLKHNLLAHYYGPEVDKHISGYRQKKFPQFKFE